MRTRDEQLTLHLYAAIIELVRLAVARLGDFDALLAQHPFLVRYVNALAERGLEGVALEDAGPQWRDHVEACAAANDAHSPLRALAAALGLDFADRVRLLLALLPEEDERFVGVLSALQGTAAAERASVALLAAVDDAPDGLDRVRALLEGGLLRSVPRADGGPAGLEVAPPLARALRGADAAFRIEGFCYTPRAALPTLDALVLAAALRADAERLAALIARGELDAAVLRGPRANGKRSLAHGIARAAGRGVLTVDDTHASLVGPLCIALHALPVVDVAAHAGDTVRLARPRQAGAPLVVLASGRGGVEIADALRTVALAVPVPAAPERAALWRAHGFDATAAQRYAQRLRITSGTLARIASGARAHAALTGRDTIDDADVDAARRELDRDALETLAVRMSPVPGWRALVAGADTRRELATLEARCRHREALAAAAQQSPGVRALFKGPSGTGKTLAARALAGALGLPLYRVDLATVVSKYVGETEKNLDRVLAAAEELDALLLLDEGDALLGARTSVSTANDRFLNLETNFLLQRLEAFEGILVVTTNAAEHIDTAFLRRMDAVVDFRAPDAEARRGIWALELGADHAVDDAALAELAWRCALSGGQIRNAALHARLLALAEGHALTVAHVDAGVEREYRKSGAVYPARRVVAAVARG